MKILVTIDGTAPFVHFQSADSAEKQIATLQAELNSAVKSANSVTDWVKGELAFVDSEIADACKHLDNAFEKVEAAKRSIQLQENNNV